MEDPVLNRNLEEMKELQARWNQFHDFVGMAMQQGPSKITAQAEMKFLELKSRIAMLHDGFMSSVKSDAKTAQNIIQIVADCILLKKMAYSSDAEKQKFEFDWNECFMLLNETVTSLEEEKKRLAGINERAYRAAQMRDLWRARIHNFLHSALLKWSVIVFGTIGGLIAVEYIIGYHEIPKKFPFTQGAYNKIVNNVWRPYIGPDYEYNNMAEVEADLKKLDLPSETKDNGTPIGEDQFKKEFLMRMGFGDGLAEARKMLENRKEKAWWTHQYELQGGVINYFAILFDTSADAKKFIELCRNDLNKASAQRASILDKTYVRHKANLVAIGIGSHPMHSGYVDDHWRMLKPSKNELE